MNPLHCKHERTRLARVICRNGTTHVMEECQDCGVNVRGPGKWVPRIRIGCPVSELPLARDLRSPEERGEQPTLF